MERQITWLASYPKSGNTWLRFIVFHLVHDRMPVSSAELDGFLGSRVPAAFAEAPLCCRARRPDVVPVRGNKAIFCKTHATAAALAPLEPRTARAIYVHRHPLGVLQSSLNYARLTGELELDMTPDAWIDSFIENAGNPLWKTLEFAAGSWADNIRSWRDVSEFPVLFVSYEATLADPAGIIAQVANFLGAGVSGKSQQACAAATSFQALKDFEEREVEKARESGAPQGRFTVKNRKQAVESGVRFFNRGSADSFRNVLSADQIARAWKTFGAVAETLGYKN
jgi:aryl sulfotransferase